MPNAVPTEERSIMQIVKIVFHYLLYAAIAAFHVLIDNLHKLSAKLMPAMT